MSGIDTYKFLSISFDLQKIALVLIVIGFIILRVGKLNQTKLKTHDTISTIGYLLVVLSVPYMVNNMYDITVSQSVPIAILIHSLIGILVLFFGFIVVINRRDWKLKRRWKTKGNMQTLLVLWLVNFILGAYIYKYM